MHVGEAPSTGPNLAPLPGACSHRDLGAASLPLGRLCRACAQQERGLLGPGAALEAQPAAASRQDTGPKHLPCSTSPMVVPEAAVDTEAGAVVCLPTVSTGLETRGRGKKRQRKQKKIRVQAG